MPLYSFLCTTHGEWEDLLPISQASVRQKCPDCGNLGERLYPPVSKHRVSFAPHFNSGADQWFETKRELHTWCDKNNTGIKTNTGVLIYG